MNSIEQEIGRDFKITPRMSMLDGKPTVQLTGKGMSLALHLDLEDARKLRAFLDEHHEKLRPSKDWKNCPYEGHADDCDCQGMCGDR